MRHFPRCTWKDYVSPMKRVMLACFRLLFQSITYFILVFFLFQHTNGSHRFSKCIFCFVCAAVISYQNNLGKKNVSCSLQDAYRSVMEKLSIWRQDLKQRQWRRVACQLGHPGSLMCIPGSPSQGQHQPRCVLSPYIDQKLRNFLTYMPTRPAPMKATPQWSVPAAGCAMMTTEANCDNLSLKMST